VAKKTKQALTPFGLRTSALAVASCLAFAGVPLAGHAAGLGKIVVYSALGQPLRAEIELSATREELSDMKAQLASADAFKQAGLDYATSLVDIRFSLDKRTKGPSVIKLSSSRPINDPFIDMLLQLDWPAGRLIREYTFLLDPPEVAAKATSVVTPAVAKSAPTARATKRAASSDSIDDELRSKALARIRSRQSGENAAPSPSASSVDRAGTHEVRNGETLRRIASQAKPDGVSLEQMLVGLLRANQDAFDNGNMNRLKAGKILSIPEKTAIEAVSQDEAKKIVVAQSSDWNAYRSRLAGLASKTSVAEDAATQETSGKITAKVDDKATASSEPSDQLKVSKTNASAPKSSAKPATGRSDEDLIAKEKALAEANERVRVLEKNVADLQKLLELKNQSLAEMQKHAMTKTKPVEGGSVAESVKPSESTTTPVKEVEVAKPEETKAAEPVVTQEPKPEPKAAPTPPPVEQKPVAAAKTVATPPPPVEEPGFFAELMDNPLALPAGGGLLALLAAYFIARRRRVNKEEVPLELSSTLSPQSASLSGNSVFRSTGGQSVDTSHTPAQTDFSQAGPGSIDTDEVDPVAEADVYMAYGRDAQAEEILLEAKQKDPKRHAIHVKLLEIYSNRKDVKQFETLATDLYGETGGSGADWVKAAALGALLIPDNPLFGGAGSQSTSSVAEAPAEEFVASDPLVFDAPISSATDVPSVETVAAVDVPEVALAQEAPDLTSLDFDLGQADEKPIASGDAAESAQAGPSESTDSGADSGALDFDLGAQSVFFSRESDDLSADETAESVAETRIYTPESVPDESSATVVTTGAMDLDFDFETDIGRNSKAVASEANTLIFDPHAETVEEAEKENKADHEPASDGESPASIDGDGVEFDVSLTESTFLGRTMLESPSFDMDSIDLDLNAPELPISSEKSPSSIKDDAPDALLEQLDAFDEVQVSTAVNPDFANEQAETVVNPQFGVEQDQDLLPEFDISANEEVTTKLDLAKAYEEMGDFEGARELLQEVLKEGDVAQREKAQAILAKIGE